MLIGEKIVPTETGSGTHQRVALDLLRHVMEYEKDKQPRSADQMLRLYKNCLRAAHGAYPPD